MSSQLISCQCEHACHMHDEGRKLSPNGNPGHVYGKKFYERALTHVKTPFGVFTVCPDCAQDCYANFPRI